jgi:hypothetical protein
MDKAPDKPDKPLDKAELIPVVTMDAATERRLTVVLVASLATLLAGGTAVNLLAAPRNAEVITLADLSGATLVEIRADGGAVVLSGEFRSRVDALGNTEKDADLGNRRGDSVIGEVELEIPAPGRDHRRPELEVDIIHLSPRTHYTVVIDDQVVGSFVTDDRGSVDFELQEGELVRGTSALVR